MEHRSHSPTSSGKVYKYVPGQILKIFSDSPLSEAAAKVLTDGVAPHEVIFPRNIPSSVLDHGVPDPRLAEADIAFGQPDVAGVLASARLRWVQVTSAGYARYDNPEFRSLASARGLVFTNSSAVYADPCAEHVLAFMLAQGRCLPEGLQSSCENGSADWHALRNRSVSLRHQKMVILGFGAIAVKLVDLVGPFAMQVVALRRRARGDEGVPVVTVERLREALADADHVVNILPDNAGTAHFVSEERLGWMKPGAVFYNIGRGTTVDQEALIRVLRSGQLKAAWLDVTEPEPLPVDHPLRTAPNCYITPHVAGGHRNETESLVRHFLDNFRQFLEGAALRDRIL